MVELAEQIATVSDIPDAKVFLTTSGTEANDTALLLASSLRGSNQILALRNSYHGRSFSTVAITGNRSWSPTSLSPFQVYYVHGGQQYRSPFAGLSDGEYIAACVADLKELLDHAGGDIAALIAEPIQGVGGFTSGPDGLLGAFAEVLRERGILWISDEVQTGWGRTGEHFWGWQAHRDDRYRATPDIVTFAKGVGNGLSMGGVIARPEVMDCLHANSISTFGGSPLTAAGALANLRYLLDHKLQDNAAREGPTLLAGLREMGSPIVGDVRGKGLMIGVELVRPDTGSPGEPAPELASAVLEAAKRRGLLVGKGGLHGNVLRIAPPLSLTTDEAREGLEALVASIEEVTP
jgi:4-aminobutyrate aminotransferase